LGPVDFEWYPYDTISNFVHIEDLLGDFTDLVLGAAKREGVIDVGCGDGELSSCFEEQGYEVLAVDHPTPNHNAMRGVRALARQLGSKVEIHKMDLDSPHSLGGRKLVPRT
jgi:tRNA (mo5U34)-methyltransferase